VEENEKRWLTIREAARHIGMSIAFLRKATRNRSVPFCRVGSKALRFDRQALDQWLMAHSSGGKVSYHKYDRR
jgi:excisionase family DNA binding protein